MIIDYQVVGTADVLNVNVPSSPVVGRCTPPYPVYLGSGNYLGTVIYSVGISSRAVPLVHSYK